MDSMEPQTPQSAKEKMIKKAQESFAAENWRNFFSQIPPRPAIDLVTIASRVTGDRVQLHDNQPMLTPAHLGDLNQLLIRIASGGEYLFLDFTINRILTIKHEADGNKKVCCEEIQNTNISNYRTEKKYRFKIEGNHDNAQILCSMSAEMALHHDGSQFVLKGKGEEGVTRFKITPEQEEIQPNAGNEEQSDGSVRVSFKKFS